MVFIVYKKNIVYYYKMNFKNTKEKFSNIVEKPAFIFVSGFTLGYLTNVLIKKCKKIVINQVLNRFFKKSQK